MIIPVLDTYPAATKVGSICEHETEVRRTWPPASGARAGPELFSGLARRVYTAMAAMCYGGFTPAVSGARGCATGIDRRA